MSEEEEEYMGCEDCAERDRNNYFYSVYATMDEIRNGLVEV